MEWCSMERIQPYRQPLVTATGIFLGFMLDFANGWLPSAFSRTLLGGIVVALCLISSIALLVIVLYRILRMDYPQGMEDRYYKTTLYLFIFGVSIPFLSIMLIMVERFLTHMK